jgi:hypothetical protein
MLAWTRRFAEIHLASALGRFCPLQITQSRSDSAGPDMNMSVLSEECLATANSGVPRALEAK